MVTLGYLYGLIRDRHIGWHKVLLAQLSMPFGAVAAVWFITVMTGSKLANIGGPTDVIVLMMIAVGGALGAANLVYTVQSLFAAPGHLED